MAQPPRQPSDAADRTDEERSLRWFTVANACFSNAEALVGDAELLLAHDRPPRALALAVLATEELGKGLAAMAVISTGGDPAMEAAYERSTRWHLAKLDAAGAWAVTTDPSQPIDETLTGRLQQSTDTASERKMAALYVDASDGALRTPASISREEATEYVSRARTLQRSADMFVALNDTDDGVHLLWQHGPGLLAALEQAMAESDEPGDVLDALRAFASTASGAATVGRTAEAPSPIASAQGALPDR